MDYDRKFRPSLFMGVILLLLAAPFGVRAETESEFEQLHEQFFEHFWAYRTSQAEETALQLQRLANGPLADNSEIQARALACHALAYTIQGQFGAAEEIRKQELRIREDVLKTEDAMMSACVGGLANLYVWQGRYAEAEPLYKRALRIAGRNGDSSGLLSALHAMGYFYLEAGRYVEAEHIIDKTPAIARSRASRDSANDQGKSQLTSYHMSKATLYSRQGRDAEAEPHYERALAAWKARRPPEHPMVLTAMHNLAGCYIDRRRYTDAESLLTRCLRIEEEKSNQAPWQRRNLAMTLSSLGVLCNKQDRGSEAKAYYERALRILLDVLPHQHPDIALIHYNLARCCENARELEQAESQVDRAITIYDALGISSRWLCESLRLRADIRRKTGRLADAAMDLRRGMEEAEDLYEFASGSEREQSWTLEQFRAVFEEMVALQLELSDAAATFDAMERSRARALLKQFEQHRTDLLAGISPDEADVMRGRLRQASVHVAELQKQLALLDEPAVQSPEDQHTERTRLQRELKSARWDYQEAYSRIRNASRVHQLTSSQDNQSVSLHDLQSWLRGQDALGLMYFFGEERGFLFVIPGDASPSLVELQIDKQRAQLFGIEAGPLTAKHMDTTIDRAVPIGLLSGADQDGSQDHSAILEELRRELIPQNVARLLLQGDYSRLIVFPDGALARLPFEMLVVKEGDSHTYLLDKGPPILYAPSATVLTNLAKRTGSDVEPAEEPVLTIGDCRYGNTPEPDPKDVLAQIKPGARYRAMRGGTLPPLPHTANEVRWTADVFKEANVDVAWLRRELATEATVRHNVPGRRILHFACHGLVDQAYGNLFGALALTPGAARDNPADDGFLTLAEIYELDLGGCELAILSACDTNSGPEQRGEGVWALSRGFLVAGARRVVASNWLVDDEAAASLVSYFCGCIAKAEAEGQTPDYAEALWEAKSWVRNHPDHPEWSAPYFWAPFVLVGPN